ncbi:uncharacterized protein EI90DRAFT_3079332 [Cantharellus anzutake]|uniref:uncharacterized protein n=1 Tax=Cantharellus anzutake TaxID=1750568 RepID=UPI0019073547|nr:uncharacterized protein EI90DRAFT_3079332 [Cantharellus anzutake]KAF8321418.1 hypothetical protein EI90DRAFT_3079332 [Cantharellus anzutake]
MTKITTTLAPIALLLRHALGVLRFHQLAASSMVLFHFNATVPFRTTQFFPIGVDHADCNTTSKAMLVLGLG